MQKVSLLPISIFCPKCGKSVRKVEINDVEVLDNIKRQGYNEAARYICSCGLVSILLTQYLPKSPTYTLMFDLYKLGGEVHA